MLLSHIYHKGKNWNITLTLGFRPTVEAPFGSDYSMESSWVWRNKLYTPGFGDFLCRSSRALLGWVRTVGRKPYSGLSRDVQLGSSQGSGWSLSRWRVNLRPEAIQFSLGVIRPENLVSHILSVLQGPFFSSFKPPSRLSCVFLWGEVFVWPLCHKAQIGGVKFLLSSRRISGAQPQEPSGSRSPLLPRPFSTDRSVWLDSQLSEESWLFQTCSI